MTESVSFIKPEGLTEGAWATIMNEAAALVNRRTEAAQAAQASDIILTHNQEINVVENYEIVLNTSYDSEFLERNKYLVEQALLGDKGAVNALWHYAEEAGYLPDYVDRDDPDVINNEHTIRVEEY